MIAASESVESQRKGIVKIIYPTNLNVDRSTIQSLPSPEERKIAETMNDAIPIRVVALHFCVPDTFMSRLFRAMLILSFSRSEGRFRVISHSGMSSACWII